MLNWMETLPNMVYQFSPDSVEELYIASVICTWENYINIECEVIYFELILVKYFTMEMPLKIFILDELIVYWINYSISIFKAGLIKMLIVCKVLNVFCVC